jgi:dihydroorotase
MSLVVKDGRVFFNGGLVEADVLCEDGKIKRIAKSVDGDETLKAGGKLVLPGVIDAHVHFRTPGMEHKEDWKTGSKSAVKGGVTTVFDMPNTNPPTTTLRLLEEKRKLVAGKSLVNYGFYFGAAKDNLEGIRNVKNVPGVKVYMASTTGNLLVDDEESIEKVFKAVKEANQLAFCHAEDEVMVKKATEKAREFDSRDPLIHGKTRPKQCTLEGARTACKLAKKVGNRLHVTHVTTAEEASLVKSFDASCDTTTTYLFLDEGNLKALGNYGKINPPVRARADQIGLWKELKRGKVDMITTDHAPHTREEKERDYWDAPSGAPGVQTLVPLLLNEVNWRNLSLNDFVRLVSENPARITRAKGKGRIAEGMDADLTIADMKLERVLTDDEIESKCGWTPFAGRRLKGWPVATVVNGELAWDGAFYENRGKEALYG